MAKVSGSYKSLIRGVSEQVPEERLPGQHAAQDNTLSDPVRGLIRRQGSLLVNETAVQHTTADDLAASYRGEDIKIEDRELTVLLRRPAAAPGSGNGHNHDHSGHAAHATGPAVWALQRGAYPGSTDGTVLDTYLTSAAVAELASGVTAHAVVGRFLLLAHGNTVADADTSDQWGATSNQRLATIQVRGGAYSRTFTVRLKRTGSTEVAVSYTTPASSYGGTLDTSDILASDPEYQKKVNDRINAYNSAVTAWLGTAAAAIQPAAVAEGLRAALAAAGAPAGVVARVGATVVLAAPSDIEYMRVDDAGDGSLMKGTFLEIKDAQDLPPTAPIGMVVKVSPTGDASYFLKAEGTGTSTVDGLPVGQVTWVECAAVNSRPANPFCIGAIHNHKLYVGASPADLEAALPPGHGIVVPPIGGRVAGDVDSSPAPHFVSRVITYMGVFQDRLLIGSENVINASRIGDYFNFYRVSALTAPDDDPVEMYANGSEDDTLRYGVFFDRSLIVFGDKQQYAISGKVPLTPATSTMAQSSAHRDTTGLRPLALGDLVFYAKSDGGSTRMYQIAVGNVDDTTNSAEVTQQLDGYLAGAPEHAVGISLPGAVVVKTTGSDAVYVFRYIDSAQERLLDSWSRWTFAPGAGRVIALSTLGDRLRILYARTGTGQLRIAVDEFSLVPGKIGRPYLDSASEVALPARSADAANMHCAYGAAPTPLASWQGTQVVTVDEVDKLRTEVGTHAGLYVGFPFTSSTRLTSPFPRDSNDAPIVTGRTTISALVLAYASSIGMRVDVTTPYGDSVALDYTGLTFGQAYVGHLTPRNGVQRVIVGREVRDYEATISSKLWHPLAITSIDWVGQYMNNTRRV